MIFSGKTKNVKDSVFVVTGSNGGIGRAIVSALRAYGVGIVVGCDLHGSDFDFDVRSSEGWWNLMREYDDEVDFLINNAGIMPTGPFLEMSEKSVDDQIDINLRGVINGMRAVLPGMISRQRGHIINIASMLGVIPIAGGMIYSATKHAVVGLSESARKEYEREGVLVSHVLPTLVNTQMIAGVKGLRFIKPVSPETVAKAIIRAVEKKQIDIWVPGSMKWLIGLGKLLPRSFAEYLAGEFVGMNHMFMQADQEVRDDYARHAVRVGR